VTSGRQALKSPSSVGEASHVRHRKGNQRGRSDGGVSTGALNHGIDFFDTVEMYAHGQSEIIIGKGLKKCGFERDDFVGTTKLVYGDD
jgi:aryl-alcohol dehydrogenase-like predicted oxidoreductase